MTISKAKCGIIYTKVLKIHDEHKCCGLFFVYQLRCVYFRIQSDFCYGWIGNKKAAEPITTAGLGDCESVSQGSFM